MDAQQSIFIGELINTTFEKILIPYMRKLHGLAKDEIEKFRIDWNKSFSSYLTRSFEKYSKIKTILFQTEPKHIYDIFEPPILSIHGRLIQTENVEAILQESHFVIITGEGGIGKSTLLKHLFINTINTTEQIPIFLELSTLNTSRPTRNISELIDEQLDRFGCPLQSRFMEYALNSGCFTFFFDGYDEVYGNQELSFFSELDRFCDKYPNNYFIITSRPFTEFIEFHRFTVMLCEPLTKNQAISLIMKINSYDDRTKSRFISDLDNNLFQSHFEFVSNPLLLNIMLFTYDAYAEMPAKRHILYDHVFEAMYLKHDRTKPLKRYFNCNIPYVRFKKILACFCFIVYSKRKSCMSKDEVIDMLSETQKMYGNFDEIAYMEDLINVVCILYKDSMTYRFIHKSFLEYFVSFFLKELPDEDLTKTALQIIREYERPDDVFIMLRDMITERFEKIILIPYLRKVDENLNPNISKYEQYLEILFWEIRIEYKSGIVKGLAATPNNEFLVSMAKNYALPDQSKKDFSDLTKILNRHGELKDIDIDLGCEIKQILAFDIPSLKTISGLYEAIESTWIGAYAKTMSELLT